MMTKAIRTWPFVLMKPVGTGPVDDTVVGAVEVWEETVVGVVVGGGVV